MPAHTTEDCVGVGLLGNGERLIAIDHVGNDEADRLAKLVVEQHRVPLDVRLMVKEHEELLLQTARWLGVVTVVVVGDSLRDTTANRKRAYECRPSVGREAKSMRIAKPTVVRHVAMGGGIAWSSAAVGGVVRCACPARCVTRRPLRWSVWPSGPSGPASWPRLVSFSGSGTRR